VLNIVNIVHKKKRSKKIPLYICYTEIRKYKERGKEGGNIPAVVAEGEEGLYSQ
jgi:hypothetical protein